MFRRLMPPSIISSQQVLPCDRSSLVIVKARAVHSSPDRNPSTHKSGRDWYPSPCPYCEARRGLSSASEVRELQLGIVLNYRICFQPWSDLSN